MTLQDTQKNPIELTVYLLKNFGPLIIFYAANHYYGLKPAIVCAIGFTMVEVLYLLVKKQPFSSFFKFSAGMTIVFGLADLILENPMFFKFEPTVTNLVTAFFFGASLWTEKTLIQEFTEKRDGNKEMTAERIQRCRWLTLIWVGYFFVKAIIYFFVAEKYSIEEALLIRSTYGTISFYILLGWSIFLSKSFLAKIPNSLKI